MSIRFPSSFALVIDSCVSCRFPAFYEVLSHLIHNIHIFIHKFPVFSIFTSCIPRFLFLHHELTHAYNRMQAPAGPLRRLWPRGFDMKNIWLFFQTLFAAIGFFWGWFLGSFDGFLFTLIAFMVIDYVTGVLCAVICKSLSSKVGFRGITRKLLILLMVGIGHLIDTQLIGYGSTVRAAVILFYLSNEGLSILKTPDALVCRFLRN